MSTPSSPAVSLSSMRSDLKYQEPPGHRRNHDDSVGTNDDHNVEMTSESQHNNNINNSSTSSERNHLVNADESLHSGRESPHRNEDVETDEYRESYEQVELNFDESDEVDLNDTNIDYENDDYFQRK